MAPFGIQVIVIQPGVVATPLAESTLAGLEAPRGSPYADALRRFREFLRKNAGDAISAEDVARVIVSAAVAEPPRTRYRVGPDAGELPALRRRLGDEGWDEMYRGLLGGP